jgi:hypothetical protein
VGRGWAEGNTGVGLKKTVFFLDNKKKSSGVMQNPYTSNKKFFLVVFL